MWKSALKKQKNCILHIENHSIAEKAENATNAASLSLAKLRIHILTADFSEFTLQKFLHLRVYGTSETCTQSLNESIPGLTLRGGSQALYNTIEFVRPGIVKKILNVFEGEKIAISHEYFLRFCTFQSPRAFSIFLPKKSIFFFQKKIICHIE